LLTSGNWISHTSEATCSVNARYSSSTSWRAECCWVSLWSLWERERSGCVRCEVSTSAEHIINSLTSAIWHTKEPNGLPSV